jgi:hypothetical protein
MRARTSLVAASCGAVAGLIRLRRASDPRIHDVFNALLDDRQVDVHERARALRAKR